MNDPQHDERMERSLRVWLTEGRPPLADRDTQIDFVLGHLDEAPQARRRILGRWFDRGEGARRRTDAHDHPPDTNRRNRLMLSATGLMTAFAILAISVNVVNTTETSPPSAGGGAEHSVAADGSGDFSTIDEAVEAAQDGDTISVQPGTYTEAIVIDKDISLVGEGSVEEIVITGLDDPAMWVSCQVGDLGEATGCSVALDHADATIANLTFRGDYAGLVARGGAPVLEGLVFEDIGGSFHSPDPLVGWALSLRDGTQASVQDSRFLGGASVAINGGSSPTLEGNTFEGGGSILVFSPGDDAIIRDNVIDTAERNGIELFSPTRMLIEGNRIHASGKHAIKLGGQLSGGLASGVDPFIRGNVISATDGPAIIVGGDARPTIADNEFSGNRVAIQIGRADAIVTGNRVEDGATGFVVVSGGSPTITDNTIDVTGRGIAIGKGTSPIVHGNDVCGGEISIRIADDAKPDLGENQTCEGAVTE